MTIGTMLSSVTYHSFSSASEISFFIPHKRTYDLIHPTSIITACYQTFDQFRFSIDPISCPIPILLQFPFQRLFPSIPPGH
ncbi:uncharacterized protein B0P05DRAFT_545369 [Gilbertella persicaria]|uniref:uncharacterized protein n=1 Tax=Gilbertella persicaria TaxID=101096 RepID=UPI00221ED48A|nr:uncharacterized protein B0P05DRAFT_545369 [Gilbertella persicaria]KAI8076662.1 hypothetical protein B0P05DRAFT_545369 [Gilbertella persicaria]